jgi:prepilin-type N-terminal cleavage/methylation domain-containing protein
MQSAPFIHKCKPRLDAGFSLIELLVSLFISSVMLTLMTGFFRATVNVRHDMGLQTEAQQGLRALFEMVTQELRQAGACLPQQGQFIILDGVDSGGVDSLTLRIGRTDETLRCIAVSTITTVNSSTLPLTAGDGDLFAGADLVYVTPDGATGDFYRVTAHNSTSITLDRSGNFPAHSGIYAIDERVYQVETIDGRSVLTVSIDGSDSYPIVDGVKKFNVQYYLESNSDPNALDPAKDLPEDDTEWRRVRKLTITGDVEARNHNQDGTTAHEEGDIDVKPRNLL